MLPFKHMLQHRDGSMLVVVVLILMSVTVMGLAAINISSVDIHLAGNQKWEKSGFYNADSGAHGTGPVIAQPFRPHEDAPLPADPDNPDDPRCLLYLNGMTPTKFEEMLLQHVGESGCDPDEEEYRDISFRHCKVLADIDICPVDAKNVSGGGIDFAANAEGLGLGGGSQKDNFRVTSTGEGASSETPYTTKVTYRWLDVSGGIN